MKRGIKKFGFSVWLLICFFCGNAQVETSYLNLEVDIQISAAKSVNTKNLESSPTFYQNGVVFVYARERSKLMDPNIGTPFFELMYSEIGPDGELRRAVNFSPTIRSKFHEGPTTFNSSFDEMYFTRTNSKSGKGVADAEKLVNLNILSAKKGPDDWEEVELLPFCNDEFSVCHPTLSSNGDYMIFASDMPGGVGGMDLYLIEKVDGIWQVPTNLGEEINTPKNEIFPTLHDNGILFFSSNGHNGSGGLDILAAQNVNGSFTSVTLMPIPFNSRKDDLGLVVDKTGKYGLFASDRKGGKGKDDLFIVRMDESIFNVPQQIVADVEVEFESETDPIESIETMPDESIQKDTFQEEEIKVKVQTCIDVVGKIMSYKGNEFLNEVMVLITNRCTGESIELFSDQGGKYSSCVQLNCAHDVKIYKPGYKEETFNYTPDPDNNAVWNIFLKEKEKELFIENELEAGKVIVLNNIYYDFNKSAIQKGAATELNALVGEMKKYPSMIIELIAHTDSRGQAQYNLELSERRAFAAKDYLTARGILGSRIKVKPVGEQQIRNECIDGVDCTEEQHQYNRRTEVKILEVDADVKIK